MSSLSAIEIVDCVVEWHKTDRTERLGQFLMNKLVPEEKNHRIFYEVDPGKALKKFMNKYMKAYD